jgi:AcrR family transcriptional regulator
VELEPAVGPVTYRPVHGQYASCGTSADPLRYGAQVGPPLRRILSGMTTPAEETEPVSGRQRLLEAAIGYFAEHGIGDASLRQIAAGVGSSHRMLIYHFGSREGLLEAVVDELERGERDVLNQMLVDDGRPSRVRSWEFWVHVVDVVDFYGPLYFELASHAMHSADPSSPLRAPNVNMWVQALGTFWKQEGLKSRQSQVQARLSLAVARGLLHDFLLTRDRRTVDQAMAMYDWLCFQQPHPVKRVARATASWELPSGAES